MIKNNMNENPPIVQRITSASQVDAYWGNSIYELITDKNGRRVFVHRDGAEFNRFIKPNCEKRLFYYINTGDLELSYRFDDVYYCSERLSADVKFKVRLCPAVDSDRNHEFAAWINTCEFLSIGDLATLLCERLKQYFSSIVNGATTLALVERHGAGAVSDDKAYWTDAGLPSWLEIVETSSIQATGEARQELIEENDRIARARERQRKLLEQIDIVVTEDKLANVKDEISHRNDMLRKQRELELQEHNHLVAKRQMKRELELLKLRNDIKGFEDKERELEKKEEEIISIHKALKDQSEKTLIAIGGLFNGISRTLNDICRSTTKTADNTDLMVSLLKKIAGIIASDHTMSQYRSLVTKKKPRFVINNQFEMIRRIGSGEQGDVYQAYDTNVGKTVAVKCLDPRTTKDDAIWKRLVKESEILLSIPRSAKVNLPWFRSSGREIGNGDKPFFVMEFIDGYALSSVLKHRAISAECTKEEFSIQILLQIATAVDYLHEHEIIHRDIKSGNIIFSRDAGAAYLVDFGSASTLSDTENWNEKIKVASGTLPYMSPEQRQELPPSFSQDVFSFSVLAYECFTGEYPFNVQDSEVKNSVEWNKQLDEAKAKLDKVQIPLQMKEQILSGLSYDSEKRPKNCSVILVANEVRGGVIKTEVKEEHVVTPESQESLLGAGSNDRDDLNVNVTFIPRDITAVKTDAIPVQIFSGASVRPECHLVDEEFDYTLEKGKDYIVQYESVDVPGFAAVVITGIGEYCGEKRVQFEIKKEETPKPIPSPLKKIPCDQFEDYEGVYDGKIHGLGLIENACVSEIDAQLTWFNNKTKSWEKKFPGFVDVCDRTFTVKITAPGYAEHTELRRIRILPKPLSLDMVENVSFSEYEDGDGGFITSRLKMKDVEPCVIQDKDWAIVETGTKTDLIVVTGRGNYCGTLEIKIKEDKNSTEDFSVGSSQSKQGRKWRAWLQLLGSLLLLVALLAPIDWSGILSFNSDFDKGENQFSDSYENVTSPGWGFNPTPCKAPDYVYGERYKDGDCRTFTLPVKAKYPDGVHSVKMEMVYVAPGEFNMGSEDDVLGAAPIHPVKITKGYWIAKYPVTQAQWVTLIAYSKLKLKNDRQWFCSVGGGKDYVKGLDTSDFPMESISWNDCDALVKALNSNETLSVEWMIPTEAQWEFAAKGGNKSKGYKFSGCDDIDMVGWYENNSGGRTHSVLEKVKGNELGIVGMSGNVWEWCRDTYDSGYYQQCKVKGMVEDPCNVAASGYERVLRGGCWYGNARGCRSAYRSGGRPGARFNFCGFRLCCSTGPHENLTEQESRVDDSRPDGTGGSTTSGTAESTVKKINAELEKKVYKAFVAKDWKAGFDIATNLTINSISDSYVTYHVGYCYSPTYGTDYPKEKDYEEAYKWFKYTAALEQKSGDGIVQCILGDMEMNGQGCATNIDNAVAWYRISAERKYNRGCYELGKCYEDSIVADTNDNLVAATNWYFKAMSLEYESAKEAHERVLKKIKDREALQSATVNQQLLLASTRQKAPSSKQGVTNQDLGVKWKYEVLKDGTISLEGEYTIAAIPKSTCGAIVIPPIVDGYTVSSIGRGAFRDCANLTAITIPRSITNIQAEAFNGCKKLKDFYVDSQNSFFKSESGLLLSNDRQELISYPGGRLFVSIPDCVIKINEGAFYSGSVYERIEIPSSVVKIENWAFAGYHSRLSSISVDIDNEFYMIDNGMLVTKDGKSLLRCPPAKDIKHIACSIPYGIEKIEEGAFAGCSLITRVEMPDSVKHIGRYAFFGCKSLRDISMSRHIKKIEEGVFSGCSSLKTVVIPDGVTHIGRSAFYMCDALSSIEIPKSVEHIGSYAFGCSSLENIEFLGDRPIFASDWAGRCSRYGVTKKITVPDSESWRDVKDLERSFIVVKKKKWEIWK